MISAIVSIDSYVHFLLAGRIFKLNIDLWKDFMLTVFCLYIYLLLHARFLWVDMALMLCFKKERGGNITSYEKFYFLHSMHYLINVVLRIDCSFVVWAFVIVKCGGDGTRDREALDNDRALERRLQHQLHHLASPRGPTLLWLRYNYHHYPWLYVYLIVLLKWILLQQVSEFSSVSNICCFFKNI
jgi:hypothetical protein